MQRLDAVSPRMRHRVGNLVDQYASVICDCGTEFVARPGAAARCPSCGHIDIPSVTAIADAVDDTIAVSASLDLHLTAAAQAAKEPSMTTTHRVRGIARLIQNVHAMNAEADRLADEMERHSQRVTDGMATTRAVVDQVKQAADELEAANALFTNASGQDSAAASSAAPAATAAARA